MPENIVVLLAAVIQHATSLEPQPPRLPGAPDEVLRMLQHIGATQMLVALLDRLRKHHPDTYEGVKLALEQWGADLTAGETKQAVDGEQTPS